MIDHNQLFKTLLKEFFLEFVEVFLPAVSLYLDPRKVSFLDKELFGADAPGGKRNAELAVKVKFKNQPAFFLIHIEPQSTRRRRGAFAERMFDYFALLRRASRLPVYPVALLPYDKPRNLEPNTFRIAFPDQTVLEFRFAVIQLNRLNWRDSLRRDNPAAAALMAQMGFAPAERVEVKKECLRMIARLRYDPEKTRFLAGFVDPYLRLNAEEEQQFVAARKKLPRAEREVTMEITTSWEEAGLRRGLQEGLQEGLQREHEFVRRLLPRRLGALSKPVQTVFERLPIEQVEQLGEALLDFHSPEDLNRWLKTHAAAPAAKARGKR